MVTSDPTAQLMLQVKQQLENQHPKAALSLLKKLLKTHPHHVEGLYYLSQTQRMLKQWPEAIATLRLLMQVSPEIAHFRELLSMALLLSNAGRHVVPAIEEALHAMRMAPNAERAVPMAANVCTLAHRCFWPQVILQRVRPYFDAHSIEGEERLRLSASIAVAAYLDGDWKTARHYAGIALELRHAAYDEHGKGRGNDFWALYIFAQLTRDLLVAHEAEPNLLAPAETAISMHVIGESHGLSLAHLAHAGGRVHAHLLMGMMAYFFVDPRGERFTFHIKRLLRELDDHLPVMFMFGEIDCRPGSGIHAQWKTRPQDDMQSEIKGLARGYVHALKKLAGSRRGAVHLWGVPAPNATMKPALNSEEHAWFTAMIAQFNAALALEAANFGFGFVDVYTVTVAPDGWAKAGVHIDDVHITPALAARLLGSIA